MARSKTPSFVLTIPLVVSEAQNRELTARLNAAQNLYNACLAEAKKRLEIVYENENYLKAKKTSKDDKKLRKELFSLARVQSRYSETIKAESAGCIVEKFSTQKTKLSQTCICGRIEKKSLSQRVHSCECGVEVKRDVLSAFLSRQVTDDILDMRSTLNEWKRLETVLRQA